MFLEERLLNGMVSDGRANECTGHETWLAVVLQSLEICPSYTSVNGISGGMQKYF
jgi:hypothetical protein